MIRATLYTDLTSLFVYTLRQRVIYVELWAHDGRPAIPICTMFDNNRPYINAGRMANGRMLKDHFFALLAQSPIVVF